MQTVLGQAPTGMYQHEHAVKECDPRWRQGDKLGPPVSGRIRGQFLRDSCSAPVSLDGSRATLPRKFCHRGTKTRLQRPTTRCTSRAFRRRPLGRTSDSFLGAWGGNHAFGVTEMCRLEAWRGRKQTHTHAQHAHKRSATGSLLIANVCLLAFLPTSV